MPIDAIDLSRLLILYAAKHSNKNNFPRERNLLLKHDLASHKSKTITERGESLIEDLLNLANLIVEEQKLFDEIKNVVIIADTDDTVDTVINPCL